MYCLLRVYNYIGFNYCYLGFIVLIFFFVGSVIDIKIEFFLLFYLCFFEKVRIFLFVETYFIYCLLKIVFFLYYVIFLFIIKFVLGFSLFF